MEELIKYVKSVKAAHVNDVERLYLNEEVAQVLKENNLTLIELIYRVKRDIPLNKIFTCKNCGKKLEYNLSHRCYMNFCSQFCSGTYYNTKDEIKAKVRKCVKNSYKKKQEAVKDLLTKHNLTYPEYLYRIHHNIPLEKIIVCKTCGKLIEFKHHKYNTFCSLECSGLYNSKDPKSIEKRKNTLKKNFGVDSFSKTPQYKQILADKREFIQVKQMIICFLKYGKFYYAQTDEFKEKEYLTKKQNNTFKVSEAERRSVEALRTKFDDVKTQHKSDLYPFNCDAYIPSLDLYIEFNYHWTHGTEPYNKDNKAHQQLLDYWQKESEKINWKGKKKAFFKVAIDVWTKRDPRKVATAKQNNVKLLVFYKEKEFLKWLGGLNVRF